MGISGSSIILFFIFSYNDSARPGAATSFGAGGCITDGGVAIANK
jgi:hypothetical protein